MKFKIRRVVYEVVEVEPRELMSIANASRVLGMTIDGVRSAIDRGKLTVFIDPEALEQRYRRFVLRSEVEEMAARRERGAVGRRIAEGSG